MKNYIYTIIQTSKNHEDDIKTGFDAGADDYLLKPVNPTNLMRRLNVAKRVLQYEEELEENRKEIQRIASDMEKLAEKRAKMLLQADKMATLGVLSAGIAHEINNPAAFISGNIQTIDRVWEMVEKNIKEIVSEEVFKERFSRYSENVPKMVIGVKKGVDRIAKIVDGLKLYSKQNEADKSHFCINDTIIDALELCHNALKYHIEVKVHSERNLNVYGNKQMIEQVLVNLFINAAQAIGQNKQGKIDISVRDSEEKVNLIIHDNGPGISSEKADKIFDPFFTSKVQGTGLGLSISRGIIEEHGGSLELSESATGACFCMTLPVVD